MFGTAVSTFSADMKFVVSLLEASITVFSDVDQLKEVASLIGVGVVVVVVVVEVVEFISLLLFVAVVVAKVVKFFELLSSYNDCKCSVSKIKKSFSCSMV